MFVYKGAGGKIAQAPDLVKVVEGSPVLDELILADALGVTRQDLVLDLVDGSGYGGQQLLPTHTKMLQREEQRAQDSLHSLGATNEKSFIFLVNSKKKLVDENHLHKDSRRCRIFPA